ncbi:MAG TPA: hypothetical protein VI357_17035 [Mycobacteriales bacterium]
MDVHDGLGADGTHAMWEPPGHDESASGPDRAHGYDRYDDSTGPDAAGSGDPSHATTDDGSGGTEGSTTMTVEVDGEARELPAEHDYTGDGRPDAAVETADGKVIVFADTEDNATGDAGPDGKADEAYIVDKHTGQVVGAAHIDPSSGTWVEGTDQDGPSAVGSGGGEGTGGTGQTGTGETGGTTGTSGDQQSAGVATVDYGGHQIGVEKTLDTDDDDTQTTGTGATGSSGRMTVNVNGETQQLPAEKDYTGDGQADAAVETADGKVIIFADTENNETGAAGPDGKADEAWIVDKATGKVVGAAHVDPRTGEWVDGTDSDGPSSVAAGSGSEESS